MMDKSTLFVKDMNKIAEPSLFEKQTFINQFKKEHSESTYNGTEIFRDVYEHIGKVLRYIRESKGLTFDRLSSMVGIKISYLHKIEKGEARLYLDQILTLASYHNMSLEDILNYHIPTDFEGFEII